MQEIQLVDLNSKKGSEGLTKVLKNTDLAKKYDLK